MIRRGAILFEMLVSIAVFTGAGMLTLSVVGNSYASFARAQKQRLALDLARSKLAELEADLISIGDLAADTIDTVGSLEFGGDPLEEVSGEWRMEVDTRRTEYANLTLVSVTVYPPPDSEFDEPAGVTLRQLVRLRDERVENFEQDDLIRGLPSDGRSGGSNEEDGQ